MLASYETVRGRRSGEDSLAVVDGGMMKDGDAQRSVFFVFKGKIGVLREGGVVGRKLKLDSSRTNGIPCQRCFTVVGYDSR